MSVEITLYRTDDEKGFRTASARLAEDGGLVINGQDLGSSVEGFFGCFEYEYSLAVEAAEVDRCVEVLGGDAGMGLLEVLQGWVARGAGQEAQLMLSKAGLTRCVWSRTGD